MEQTTFKDCNGKRWSIHVTIKTIKRVRSLLGIDLMEILEGDILTRLSSDPCLLADVLFAVCKEDADQAGIADEQFGEGLAGDAISQATNAFLSALVEFFPDPKRTLLQRILTQAREMEPLLLEQASKKLDQALENQRQGISGNSVSNVPG